ncbi:unnamed protein product [Pleuronectes platessa]|uniref:Uncharacterized protein n=1 Tax=Pleuronectes platessa TaxID=8262 RepID=A0A9N7V5D1_PLEPL|nr:unnamed protein product [Pleuronectes platessa]
MTVKHLLGPCGVWGTGALLGAQSSLLGAQSWGAKEAVVWTHIRPLFVQPERFARSTPSQGPRSSAMELFWGPNHLFWGPNHGGPRRQWSGHTSGPSSFNLKGSLDPYPNHTTPCLNLTPPTFQIRSFDPFPRS